MKLENTAQREEEIKVKQKKVIILQEQQAEAEVSIKHAEEFYDNLSAIIMSMRLDLNDVSNELKVFKPSAHENDSPEAYLEAAKVQLPQENSNGFTSALKRTFPGFLEQLPIASQTLEQANINLARARFDLVRINRELVELTQ